MIIEEKVSNFRVTALDSAVVCDFDPVEGADGYIISFFKDDDPNRCIKKRYADKTGKTVAGFRNSCRYYASICAFVFTESGLEECGPDSEKVSFVPYSDVLTAQKKICLKVGETARIRYDYLNTQPEVVFESTNPEVARVDSTGNIIALAKGETYIVTAMDEEHFAVTSVSVARGISENTTLFGSIVFTGDLMCAVKHQKLAAGRSFDFTSEMSQIRDKLAFADARVGVLETVIDDDWPYEFEQTRLDNGAPNCNSPSSFLKGLKAAGFDVLITANNHNCDAGSAGLKSTVAHIRQNGMENAGTYFDNPVYINAGGIRVALISLCMINNGSEALVDDTLLKRDIGRYSRELVTELIHTAKSDYAEYIVVCMHWGNMNSHAISKTQRDEAQFIAEAGADLIIGSHPHLIQKAETIVTETGRRVLCAYSLGNFITTMNELLGNRDGVAFVLNLTKKGIAVSGSFSYIPFYSSSDKVNVRISCVEHPMTPGQKRSFDRIREHMGDEIGLYKPHVTVIGSDVLKRILENDDNYHTDMSYLGMGMADYINMSNERSENLNDYCIIDMYCDAKSDVEDPSVNLPKFAGLLRERYDDRHIVLLRLGFYDRCVIHDQLRNGKYSARLNERLRFLEEAFIEIVKPTVIDLAGYYFRDLTYSDDITEYEPLFYTDVKNHLKMILNGGVKSYHYEQDTELWMRRVIRYYDNMLARNYFFWLVDNDAAGVIITNTSRSFVAEHSFDLIRLKKQGVSNINDIFEYDYGVSDDIYRAARIIQTIDNGEVITDPADENVLLKYDFNICKEYAQILEDILDYPVSRAEIREAAMFLDDREEYILNHAHKKANVDIWGSCISRTSVGKDEDIVIGNYIFKQPALLADRIPMEIDCPNDVSYYENNTWRMNTIIGSITHNGFSRLEERGTDWIVIDFYDLITEVLKIDDDYFELDDFIKRTDFYRIIKGNHPTTYLFEDMYDNEAELAFEPFVKFMKEHYGQNIILIRVDCKDEYIDLNGNLQYLKKDPALGQKKAYIAKFEDMFIEKTGCHVIDISKDYYASDAFPLGGAHIVHYEDAFYEECCKEICEILKI